MKPRLLGHWGTTPGLNFLYVHLNRAIRERDLDAIYICGPGHGGPAVVANAYLEGTYSELYAHAGRDEAGLRQLFRQFSFPGGIPSHAAPETPGSIHEGGELGYALMHAQGAAFDNPDLLVACVIGDGEAETGPLATSWQGNKFLSPRTDGAVLPILQLNGYKIANPTVLARIPEEELDAFLRGQGYEPFFFTGGFEEEDRGRAARPLRRHAGRGARPDRGAPARGARGGRRRTQALAGDRLPHAEGLDRAEGGRRQAGRGHLALAPGPARGDAHERRASRAAGGVAAQLPARGALRRRGAPRARARGVAAER